MLTIIQHDAGANMEQAQRSWLSLVSFCAVTGLLVALGSAIALAGASLAFAVAQPAPGADANAVNQAGETTTVDDNDVPLANQQLPKNNNQQALPTWFFPMAGIGVLLILGSVIYLIIAKKRNKNEK